MSSGKSLLSLTFIYTLGNLSSKLISFFLIFFTTFYLSKEDVGQFDLILITVNLFLPLISLQLSDAVLRWLLDKDVKLEKQRETISTIFFFLFFTGLLFTIIYQAYSYFTDTKYAVYLNIILLLQLFYIFCQQTIRGLGYNKLYASNSVINAFFYVSISILLMVGFSFKIEALLIANITALTLTIFQLVIRAKLLSFINIKLFSKVHLKELLRYSFPLIPNSLSWWAISSSNRYLILLYAGVSANGVFAISYKIPTILVMLLGIFSLAWQEKSIRSYEREDRDDYYTSVFNTYLKVIFSISFIIVAANKLIMQHLVAPAFFEAYKYTPILILGTMFSSFSAFYGAGYLGAKKTKSLLISSILGGAITILSSLVLIPKFQLYGAAASILIGYFILFVIRIVQTKNFFNIKISYRKFFAYALLYVVIWTMGFSDNLFLLYLNLLFSLCLMYFLNKKLLMNGLKKVLDIVKKNKIVNNNSER